MSDEPKWSQIILPVVAVIVLVALVAIGGGLVEGWHSVSIVGPLLDLVMALGAGIVGVAGLRWFDRIQGINSVRKINGMDDRSFAFYLAGRLLAVAILLGLALS